MNKKEALIYAQAYLRSYFDHHRMGVNSVIQSEWARGVFNGRQEAMNILTEAIQKEEQQ